MPAKPNKTTVLAWLRKYEPAPDGYGGEMQIEIIRNESADSGSDFLQPSPGQVLRAFYPPSDSPQPALPIGKQAEITLTLLGGPGGERSVVQSVRTK